jgi:DNA-binding CsgD family transcriptional regulator
LVLPYLENLKHLHLNERQAAQVKVAEENLKKIVSPFLHNLTSSYLELTPREIQVANLVKEGMTTKEMTDILNISATAVDFHRKNLRSKFGIKNKKTNLMAFLASLS